MSTTVQRTLKTELDRADPNTLADALRLVKLGTMFTPVTENFTHASDVTGGAGYLDLESNALAILEVWVADDNTANREGWYNASTVAASGVVNTGGLSGVAVGLCKWDGAKRITLPSATVKDISIRYIPAPDLALTTNWPAGV